jgi:hypothetical protein
MRGRRFGDFMCARNHAGAGPSGILRPVEVSNLKVEVRDCMWFKGLTTSKAAEVGASLADHFIGSAAEQPGRKRNKAGGQEAHLQRFLAQVDREALPLRLGLFRRAKLANAFKWRLLDKGVEPALVDELTRILLLRLAKKTGVADT